MGSDGGGLDRDRIAVKLRPGTVIGREIHVHDEVDSTNDEVRQLGAEGAREGCVVFAESQRRGRGRRGTRWMSPAGRDLLFSVLLRPEGAPGEWAWLTQAAAIAVCRTIEALFGLPAGLKWPNDIYLKGNRKVSGILLETRVGEGGAGNPGFAVLGIGVNVNGEEFPGELRETAISLRQACGAEGELEREPLAGVLLSELDAIYGLDEGPRSALFREAEDRSVLMNRVISFRIPGGETIEGRFLGLGKGGELKIRDEKGQEREYWTAENLLITG